ncbi:ATP-binding protein [Nocardioides sp.]|uniref:ATP-binding SpoIIE family protein phosphatase n=1 Tax=Nocardioides sp. TaxID=35761 RepID=UPI0037830F96
MDSGPEPSRDAASLQGALLPLGTPIHPDVELVASAVVHDDQHAGGDWFDTLPVGDGALALVTGDVVGHGRAALAAAGQLRAAVLLAVSEDDDPGRVLTRVARYAATVPEVRGASICLAVVDAGGRSLRYAAAGYPPPVVVSPSGTLAALPTTGDGRLGCTETYGTRRATLDVQEVLLLASDGFQLPAGMAPVTQPRGDIARWVDDLLHQVAGATGLVDDAVVVAVRRRAPQPALTLRYPALPDTVGVVRHELAAWLGRAGVEPIDASALVQAVSELTSNCVEHAFPPGTDHRRTEVSVTCRLTEGCVVVLDVRDNGRWQPPRPRTERGRGLYLSRAFVDDLRIDTGPGGTRCRVRHRPFRSTGVLGASPVPHARVVAGREFGLDVTDGHVHVRGAVDPPAADELRLVLGRISAAGTRAATVDLDDVTLLCSAAVEVLSSARSGAYGEAPLEILAETGTTADRVLTWAGVQHGHQEPSR